MTDVLQIKSRDDSSLVIFEVATADFFNAEFRSSNVVARARVRTYMFGGLATLFREMAGEWRGWSGTKTWSSLEGEVELSAQSDRTGHITCTARLRNEALPTWTLTLILLIEAGELQQLAEDARVFERAVLASASRSVER